ncbi:hypothetical protein QLQ12_30515 [Actinoplanes sp. NEAU-A12]|uniref:Uncharacterized protein n=1 Tax=Actinoplanes sandaracinus TaxID=3045177 RepID=A0ABT6WTD2_9ACTN|nr:hypothetical protein [Actinoplanes sandaracinus]MDI6099064.1 hypothetical protein [Actinoplanes sandaracinus]MDI6102959.1 hypothetical protein [Actinoplanes sandaracinus]
MVGATALVAVSGGRHSVFAVLLLGLLAMVLTHALVVEIQRQARRRSQTAWYRTDTVNTILLACWALIAAAITMAPFASLQVRGLGGLLAAGYTAASIYFVVERRRAVTSPFVAVSSPAVVPESDPVTDSASA